MISCARTSPDFHPVRPRKFAATTAECHAGQGRDRCVSSAATYPHRGRNVPVSPLRNGYSSATLPQRQMPCPCSNVAAWQTAPESPRSLRCSELTPPQWARRSQHIHVERIFSPMSVFTPDTRGCYCSPVDQVWALAEVKKSTRSTNELGGSGA